MNVESVMTRDPACCLPGDSVQKAAEMMVECDCGAIPVVDDQETKIPVGIVTDRDIVVRAIARGQNPLDLTVSDVMSTDLFAVNQGDTIEDCIKQMEQHQLRRMLVVDDFGKCIGIVAQADVALTAPEHETAELVKDVSQASHATA